MSICHVTKYWVEAVETFGSCNFIYLTPYLDKSGSNESSFCQITTTPKEKTRMISKQALRSLILHKPYKIIIFSISKLACLKLKLCWRESKLINQDRKIQYFNNSSFLALISVIRVI